MWLNYVNLTCFKFLEFLKMMTRKHWENLLKMMRKKRFKFYFFFILFLRINEIVYCKHVLNVSCIYCIVHLRHCESQCDIFTILNIAWSSKKTNFVAHYGIVPLFFFLLVLLTQPISQSVCVSVWSWLSFTWKIIFHSKQRNGTHRCLLFTMSYDTLSATLEWFKMSH